jgi:hypothetical protein
MNLKKNGFDFIFAAIFALVVVGGSLAAVTLESSCLQIGIAGSDSRQYPNEFDSPDSREELKFISRLHSLVKVLVIPPVTEQMNSYEVSKLKELDSRKAEILKYLDFLLAGFSGVLKREDLQFSIEERSLSVSGAIGSMYETGISVSHLWHTRLQWLTFENTCLTGQCLVRRIRNNQKKQLHGINGVNNLISEDKFHSKDSI